MSNSAAEALGSFTCAGAIGHKVLNVGPGVLPSGRTRHTYGEGPFARLVMPGLPKLPGLYAWQVTDGAVVYIGQTRTTLAQRLGSNGYSTISAYNTLAREPGRKNGGQQTNCRVNALANTILADGLGLTLWYRVTAADEAASEETQWMGMFGMPDWNRRLER